MVTLLGLLRNSAAPGPAPAFSANWSQASSSAGFDPFYAPAATFLPPPPAIEHDDGMGRGEPELHQPSAGRIQQQNLLVPPVSPGLCAICLDRATGKHYGANSCDGCKGFFRRTIRKAQKYSCRFDKHCCIDKDKRNSCRHCRFQKCLQVGMKRDAVQNERDRIQNRRISAGSRRTTGSPSMKAELETQMDTKSAPATPAASPLSPKYQDYIDILQKAEAYYTASLRATVITRTADKTPSQTDRPKVANMDDISKSMHQQLLLMVEWAKTLSPFYELSMDDQVVLLRNYSAQHLLICVAYRSRNVEDYLCLTNSTCLPRTIDSSEISDVNHVTTRALDELVRPMKDLDIDEIEFVCLRAIVFFNPMARGLEDTVGRVGETRQSTLGALQQYVSKKSPQEQFRFGNLLLLLPPLQAIAQNLREDLQLASMFGMAQIDSLLQELLLSDSDKTSANAIMEMSQSQAGGGGHPSDLLAFANMSAEVLDDHPHQHPSAGIQQIQGVSFLPTVSQNL